MLLRALKCKRPYEQMEYREMKKTGRAGRFAPLAEQIVRRDLALHHPGVRVFLDTVGGDNCTL